MTLADCVTAKRALIMPLLLVLAALVVLGCENRRQQLPPPTPEVSAAIVAPERLVLTTDLPGRTSAYLIAEIRPQVNGIIQKRLFKEGTDVKAGDQLYQIDPAPFEAALESAKAALAKAEANLPAAKLRFERYKSLLAEKAVSQQDYDDKEAAFKQAEADIAYWKAAVETARINLEYTRVTAPISGRIGKSSVTDGALVTAYQAMPLATIQQIDPIYVDVPQSTAELLRLRRRLERGGLKQDGPNLKKVHLFLQDGTEYPLEGHLEFRDVTVEPSTGSVILRIVFPNPDGLLLPGMFVRAQVKEGINEKAILVPQQAVFRDPKGNPLAYVLDEENRVQQRMLAVDRAVRDRWLISEGLKEGDRVVLEGLQRIRPGMTVRLADPDAPKKTGGQVHSTQPTAQSR